MIALNAEQRTEILHRVAQIVRERFYDPKFRGVDWDAAVDKHRRDIVDAPSAEAFELAMARLLSELKASHIGFYHGTLSRATSKMAISATYAAFPVEGNDRWVFQDVHEGGPAHQAGIRSGDVLVSVGNRVFLPPEHPIFPMGQRVTVTVLSGELKRKELLLDIPLSKKKKKELPYSRPKLVTRKRLNHDIGHVRISMFPGVVGIEVAQEISSAIESLNPIDRLVLDVRGNTGGGLGVVRAMSFLTPGRLPIGGHVSRDLLHRDLTGEDVRVFDRIPANQLGVPALAFNLLVMPWISKRMGRRTSIELRTEGLGDKLFHNRTVLLVDRHTASASEMLVAFAKENRLATIVGEATPGRLLSGNKFKLPYGYWLAIPIGAYRTAAGKILEGNPIEPDVPVPFDPEQARMGIDSQMDKALEVVSRL
jgi:C-terminal processing protease CtpA/Prc